MTAEPLAPVYLLKGTDRPKVRRALARLRAHFHEASIETLSAEATIDGDAASGQDVVDACNALGLFAGGDGRLVLVEAVERWKVDDAKAVVAYLADPAPSTVLALVAEEEPRSAALVETCAKAGQVLAFDVPKPKDPSVWTRSEFERQGATVDHEAVRRLVELAGEDATTIAGEVDKVVTWAAGEHVVAEDVEALAVPVHETAPWELTDAWAARDAAGVLRAAERALEQGKEPFVVALGLASHLRLVRDAEALAGDGLGPKEIAKRLRRKSEFPVRKALAHAESHARRERDAAVVRLAALDAALKGASRLSAELELERALLDVTRPAETATRR